MTEQTNSNHALSSLKRANAISRARTQKPFLDAIARAGLGGQDGKDGVALKEAKAEIEALTKERDSLKAELAKAQSSKAKTA